MINLRRRIALVTGVMTVVALLYVAPLGAATSGGSQTIDQVNDNLSGGTGDTGSSGASGSTITGDSGSTGAGGGGAARCFGGCNGGDSGDARGGDGGPGFGGNAVTGGGGDGGDGGDTAGGDSGNSGSNESGNTTTGDSGDTGSSTADQQVDLQDPPQLIPRINQTQTGPVGVMAPSYAVAAQSAPVLTNPEWGPATVISSEAVQAAGTPDERSEALGEERSNAAGSVLQLQSAEGPCPNGLVLVVNGEALCFGAQGAGPLGPLGA